MFQAVHPQQQDRQGQHGLPAQAGLGVFVGPDVEGRQVVHPFLLFDLDDFFGPGPVGEGDGVRSGGVREKLLQGRLVSGLQQVFPLVFVGGIEQEFGVNYSEILAILVDTALAQQQNLLALGQGLDGYGPFLQGYLAAVWQHGVLSLHDYTKCVIDLVC